MWSISIAHGISVNKIMEANPNVDPNNLWVGQQICIPSSCQGIFYTIKQGDSLWLISREHNVTVQDIINLNPPLVDPNNLQVGQQICIPTTEVTTPIVNRESLTYLYGNKSEHYLDLLSKTQNSIKTVCPDFFELSNAGNLLLASSDKLNSKFIEVVHGQGAKITPFISNHWDRTLGQITLDNRENLSNQIVQAINQYNLDGVNVDIENVNELYRDQYTDFVRLLRQRLPSDKIVSVAVAANPQGWTTGWHGSYDYKALSEYAYLMIMAYDESYQGGPEGPISSSQFFNKSIQYALSQGVPKDKITAGIPFFGRYWKVGDAIGGLGFAAVDVENLLKNYSSTSRFDDTTKSAYAEVTIKPGQTEPTIWGGRKLTAGIYHIWYDSPESTQYKLNVINGYDIKGAGSWSLGQEIPSVWDFYTTALNNEIISPTPESLPKLGPSPEPEPNPNPPAPEF
ncbi:hypothetical protein FACS189465_3050 [Clostridia bacterium]|nr:hypothetical protein FACS189465_3050 [Clostridia bacterium]